MEIPTTFGALAVKILTDVVFLGLVSALLTGGLWRLLEDYGHQTVPANWKRLGSLLMPFVLTGAFYLIQAGRGALPWSIDTYYSVFLAALGAAAGKQLVFTGYTAARGTVVPDTRGTHAVDPVTLAKWQSPPKGGIAYSPQTLPERGVGLVPEPEPPPEVPPHVTPAGVAFDTGGVMAPSPIPGEHNYITADDLSGIPTLPGKEGPHDGA